MTTTQNRLGAWTIEDHRKREQRVERLTLPKSGTSKSGGVDSSTMKAVLYRLNHYSGGDAWCFVSYATLATAIGTSTKTVKRAVEALEAIGLISRELRKAPNGTVCNHYRIEWDRIDFLSANRYQGHPEQTENCTNAHGHGDRLDTMTIDTMSNRSPDRLDMESRPFGHGDQYRLDMHVQTPPDRLDTMTTKQKKGEEEDSSSDWAEAKSALVACGVAAAPSAVRNAQANGWTAAQVHEVCRQFRRAEIDGVRAWEPPLLYRHFELTAPGSPIRSAPCPAYADLLAAQRREAADRRIRELIGSPTQPDGTPKFVKKKGAGTAFRERYRKNRFGGQE